MRVRLVAGSRWALSCALLGACSLTSALDDLEGKTEPTDGGGSGGVAGSSSGGWPGTGGANTDGGAGVASTGGSAGAGAAGSGGTGGSAGASSNWWDPAWPKRLRLEIENPAPDSLPAGYEVGIGIDPALFGAGVSSYAVVSYDETTQSFGLRPFFVELAGNKTWIWTPLAQSLATGAVDSSLWIYAGKSGASGGDPAQVFLYWDGFESASSEWMTQGAPQLSGGKLVLPPYASVRSKTQYSIERAVDYALSVTQAISGEFEWICGGFQRSVDFDNTAPWLLWISREPSTIQPEANIAGAGLGGASVSLTLSETVVYGVERYGKHTVHLRDNVVSEKLTWTTADSANLQIRLTVQSDNAEASFDFVRVRHASDPPPIVSVSLVESQP